LLVQGEVRFGSEADLINVHRDIRLVSQPDIRVRHGSASTDVGDPS